MVEMDSPLPEEDESSGNSGQDEQVELEKMLYALGREALAASEVSSKVPLHTNGTANGHANIPVKEKPDLEIPRKLLHSSIGTSLYPRGAIFV